jgi:hypothetical protein
MSCAKKSKTNLIFGGIKVNSGGKDALKSEEICGGERRDSWKSCGHMDRIGSKFRTQGEMKHERRKRHEP